MILRFLGSHARVGFSMIAHQGSNGNVLGVGSVITPPDEDLCPCSEGIGEREITVLVTVPFDLILIKR